MYTRTPLATSHRGLPHPITRCPTGLPCPVGPSLLYKAAMCHGAATPPPRPPQGRHMPRGALAQAVTPGRTSLSRAVTPYKARSHRAAAAPGGLCLCPHYSRVLTAHHLFLYTHRPWSAQVFAHNGSGSRKNFPINYLCGKCKRPPPPSRHRNVAIMQGKGVCCTRAFDRLPPRHIAGLAGRATASPATGPATGLLQGTHRPLAPRYRPLAGL